MSAAPRLQSTLAALQEIQTANAARPEPAFHRRFNEIRRWQSRQVAAFHAPRADVHNGQALLRFLTRSFYLEADWAELTAHPERVAGSIGRIISDDQPLVLAVELQVAADTLDAAMADALITNPRPLTPIAYVRAFRAVGLRDLRARQIRRIGELIDLLGGYAVNRAAYWAFRLAKTPARALGLSNTYGLLAEGFAAMRQTKDLETATRAAAADQEQMLVRLLGE